MQSTDNQYIARGGGEPLNGFFGEVLRVLREDERFFTRDGEFLRNAVYEAAMKMDAQLIHLLLSNPITRERFFTDVDGVKVFDKVGFGWVINNRAFLPDSYTRFKNKIGLVDGHGDFIATSNKVELVFPYKDCVLEGGQTKEDQKREEIFYNETLAPDEVDRLLYPKVFTNAKRFSESGVEEGITEFNENDNLIIKGNNLLAIASLLRRYEGKIKCIYIDPPYNTGNDGFGYNDRFSRSSWLTFMKNRLEVAKQLLTDDGSIFIQCDENQNAYLRVLCDSIFGEDNLMNEIIWRYRTYVGQVKDYFPKKHDTIFWYKKLKRPNFKLIYDDNVEETVDYKRWGKFIVQGNKIVYGNHPETDSRFTAYLNKYIRQNGIPERGQVIYEVNGYIIDDVWEDIIALDPKNKAERTSFEGGQKPEALLQRIISSVTEEGDIVLDFFLGSGTTAAVAHKMKRRYIGIEQMDYIEDITMDRLQKVVEGSAGGISYSENWQGGGSFVYCELAKLNQAVVEEIEAASDDKTLSDIYDRMIKSGFISYKIKPREIDKSAEDYANLSTEDKKRFLMEILDKNQLYVNYCDMEDETFGVSEKDKLFTQSFYEKQ